MIQGQSSRALLVIKIVIAICLITWGGWSLYQAYGPKDETEKTMPAPTVAGEPTKKTDQEKAVYTVPADHPRQLLIPSLSIDANILPMGTKDGAIDAPASAWDAGWYNKSSLPGSSYGSMVIDGHVNDTLNGPGIFYSISRLSSGDIITIEKGDLQRLDYRVTSVTQVPVGKVNVADLIQTPAGGLHLITCGGQYSEERKTYNDRVIVTAVRA